MTNSVLPKSQGLSWLSGEGRRVHGANRGLCWLCLIPGYQSPAQVMRTLADSRIEADLGEFDQACQEVGACTCFMDDTNRANGN